MRGGDKTHQEEAVDGALLDEQRECLHDARLAATMAKVPAQQSPVHPARVNIQYIHALDVSSHCTFDGESPDPSYAPRLVAYEPCRKYVEGEREYGARVDEKAVLEEHLRLPARVYALVHTVQRLHCEA